MRVRALSIRQPWAYFIVRPDITDPECRAECIRRKVIKDIENRSWPTRMRGGFLVHAASSMKKMDVFDGEQFGTAVGMGTLPHGEFMTLPDQYDRGGIVGYANMSNCISSEMHELMPIAKRSPWFMGEYGFTLTDQTPLPFLSMNGSLGFFYTEVPDDYLPEHLKSALMA